MEQFSLSLLAYLLLFSLVFHLTFSFIRDYWWKPRVLLRAMELQNIRGPPFRFMVGNVLDIMALRQDSTKADMPTISHDIADRLFPHIALWSKLYGKPFVSMWGNEPRLVVTDPKIIKDVVSTKIGNAWGRSYLMRKGLEDVIGRGLVLVDGDAWFHQRHVVGPAFHSEKLKGLAAIMGKCTAEVLDIWEQTVQDAPVEMELGEHLSKLTADIISRTEFGSSYKEGKKVFEQLGAIAKLVQRSAYYLWFPGSSYFPTTARIKIWKLQRDVQLSLKQIIQMRKNGSNVAKVGSYGQDLLGLMLSEIEEEIPEKQLCFSMQQLIDECKTFFMAGHETTALLLTWTLMLLALYPVWQEQARAEAICHCQGNAPDADSLSKFKVIGNILNETLRLYSPVPVIVRQACTDLQLGELFVPKGMGLLIPLIIMHHDKELWGSDVNEFRPERFADGGAKACQHHMGFMPFSFGPRNCVGQNFAMMEAKIVLAMLLTRFRFHLSPKYRHAPSAMVTLKPKYGMQVIIESIKCRS